MVAYSSVFKGDQPMARFDLLRLQNGVIEEIWVNQEAIPPQREWVSGGEF